MKNLFFFFAFVCLLVVAAPSLHPQGYMEKSWPGWEGGPALPFTEVDQARLG